MNVVGTSWVSGFFLLSLNAPEECKALVPAQAEQMCFTHGFYRLISLCYSEYKCLQDPHAILAFRTQPEYPGPGARDAMVS